MNSYDDMQKSELNRVWFLQTSDRTKAVKISSFTFSIVASPLVTDFNLTNTLTQKIIAKARKTAKDAGLTLRDTGVMATALE